MRPAHRCPAGVNEKKYKNGRIVSCGWSEGSERDDSCVIADYTGSLFFSSPEIAGYTAAAEAGSVLAPAHILLTHAITLFLCDLNSLQRLF